MSGTSRPIASASPTVSEVVPCHPVRTPLGARPPASIQTKLSPRFCSASSARREPDRPMATTHTTAPMPIMMATAASTLRSVLRASESSDWTKNRDSISTRWNNWLFDVRERKREGERRALADLALDRNLAAVRLDDALDDVEAEAEALLAR